VFVICTDDFSLDANEHEKMHLVENKGIGVLNFLGGNSSRSGNRLQNKIQRWKNQLIVEF